MRWLALLGLLSAGCAGRLAAPAGHHTPPSPEVLVERAHAYARSGDLLRSEQYLVLAVRGGYPRDRALPALLEVCLRASRLRAAIAHAEPVLQAHPEQDALRYLVATLHLALGQTAAARGQLDFVLRRNPSHAEALAMRARFAAPASSAAQRAPTTPPIPDTGAPLAH